MKDPRHPTDPPVLRILLILFLAFVVVCIIGMQFQSCTNEPEAISYLDHYNTLQQPAGDTCETPELILDPAFVTGYIEITEDLQTPLVLTIGPNSYTIANDETDKIDTKLDSLYKLWHPEYKYHSVESANDFRIVSTIVDNTNDKSIFHLKTYTEYNGLRHYFGWSVQGFIFAGSREVSQFKQDAINYPSVRSFNYRNTDWDSLQYAKCDSIILGFCKLGRDWADFRWGIHSHEMIQAFIDAGWGTVLSATGPSVYGRSFNESEGQGKTIDARGQKVDDTWILWWLEKGYQVIVTAPCLD